MIKRLFEESPVSRRTLGTHGSFGKGNLFVLAWNGMMSEALAGGDGLVQIAVPDTEERVGSGDDRQRYGGVRR